jgi:hypothetical protein
LQGKAGDSLTTIKSASDPAVKEAAYVLRALVTAMADASKQIGEAWGTGN